MKEGWEYKKLGEVCEIYQPQTIASNLLKKDGKYPVFGANGMIGRYDSYNHEEPEVLLCCRGATCGAINVSFPFSWINGNAMVVKPINDSYLKAFLRYLLLTLDYSHIITGAAQPQITRKSLSPVTVPVPPLPEQQRIVDYLDSAFAKIDAMKANAEKSLNEAKALFQASLKEMLEPKEGWEEKTLPDISENLDSKRKPVTKGKREAGIYPYYGASGIVDYVSDYIFDEDILLISEDGANLVARSTPIAFSVSGKVWVNNHAHILKFQNIYTQYFVEYYFASIKIDEYVTGAAQPKFSQKNMNKLPIWIPSLSEQQRIVTTLDTLKSKVNKLQANYDKISQECDALKQAILRQVFE